MQNTNKNKFTSFMKKYGTYCVAGVLVLAMAITICVAGATSTPANVDENEPSVETNATVLSFGMPMENATLIKDYSLNELYLNSTLGRWEFHDGIDLTSSNLKVFSVADGVVTSITENSIDGVSITVKHSDKLQSVYSSLASDVLVEVGDEIKKGDQIGEVDQTASAESHDGKHLHFEMLEDGKNIDPANYLELQNK